MFWIVLGHTWNFELFVNVSNTVYIDRYLSYWTVQALFATNYTVDTFFFLSGLLTAYVIASKMMKTKRGMFYGPLLF